MNGLNPYKFAEQPQKKGHAKMNKLLTIKTRLSKAGITSEVIEMATSYYFDGEDHYVEIPVLRISCTNAFEFTAAINSLSRAKGIKTEVWNFNTYTLHVMTLSDFAKAEQAKKHAEKFLNAFWLAIHNGASQAAAIEAGKAAII